MKSKGYKKSTHEKFRVILTNILYYRVCLSVDNLLSDKQLSYMSFLCLLNVVKSRCTGSFEPSFRTTSLIVALSAILVLFSITSSRSVYATHLGTSSDVWGIEAAVIAKMHHYDPTTDTATAISRVPTLSMENGRGMASDGTNLWYTFLIEGFHGDGKILK